MQNGERLREGRNDLSAHFVHHIRLQRVCRKCRKLQDNLIICRIFSRNNLYDCMMPAVFIGSQKRKQKLIAKIFDSS